MAKRPGDVRMSDQLQTFLDVGGEKGFFAAPDREQLRADVATWLPEFRAVMDPSALSEAHKKAIQPQLDCFERTHVLLLALKGLLEGWALATAATTALEARLPHLVMGEDEEEDLSRLKEWSAAFGALFDVAALPPALKPAAVRTQAQAHEKASAELPATGAGAIYRAAKSRLVVLRKVGIDLQERMHDSLDGAFGRAGREAFVRKAAYGYDRRLRGGGRNRSRRAGDPAAAPTPPAAAGAAT